jgi:hypothetical protein
VIFYSKNTHHKQLLSGFICADRAPQAAARFGSTATSCSAAVQHRTIQPLPTTVAALRFPLGICSMLHCSAFLIPRLASAQCRAAKRIRFLLQEAGKEERAGLPSTHLPSPLFLNGT